jgi:4-diphosphocytidyl-2-C-methyl-D-erythritol kinase
VSDNEARRGATSAPVTLDAPAKLTLSLRVTGVRNDGYHLIDAEMITLDLADVLTITPESGTATSLSCDGPFAAGMPLDGSNLITRAMALVGRSGAVHVRKEIPHGGGLGGGSSDAAAVLRWAGFDDLVAASRLGADVPFCLVGGRARVRGIGEIIDPLPTEPITVTLVVPPLQVSTPAVYTAWDRLGGPTGQGPNDLESAALEVEPQLVRWRDRIGEASGATPVLAGSGATWFLHGDHGHLAGSLPEAIVIVTGSRARH